MYFGGQRKLRANFSYQLFTIFSIAPLVLSMTTHEIIWQSSFFNSELNVDLSILFVKTFRCHSHNIGKSLSENFRKDVRCQILVKITNVHNNIYSPSRIN